MYNYKVYDFDYDETKSFILQHENKFSKEQYENIVNECRLKVEDKIKRNQEIIANLKNNEELSKEKVEELELWTCNGEWDIYGNIYKIMIKEYGFQELPKPLYTFTLNGGFYGEGRKTENRVID